MRRPRPAEGSAGPAAGPVFLAFLRLGCTSFGGPVAHLGYLRAAFVARRAWLDDAAYADLVALCQFLPGPSSSQVAIGIGLRRAGLAGGIAAWAGFTLPSALAMLLFAYGADRLGDPSRAGWLRGLQAVAVAVVAQAVWNMAGRLAPDRARATLAVAAAILAIAVPGPAGQVGAILLGAAAGLLLPGGDGAAPARAGAQVRGDPRRGIAALAVFAVLLAGLPALATASGSHAVALMASFYRSGALVFGGGHVVLPLLQQAVVPPGWIDDARFLAGYGAAQAVPGPLFSFAAYLGATMHPAPAGWLGAMICLASIYLPSFLLLLGVLPFWDTLRAQPAMQRALRGVNAAVVGVLLAALYAPVWTSAVRTPADFALAAAALLLLAAWRAPAWAVVLLGAAAGGLLGPHGLSVAR